MTATPSSPTGVAQSRPVGTAVPQTSKSAINHTPTRISSIVQRAIVIQCSAADRFPVHAAMVLCDEFLPDHEAEFISILLPGQSPRVTKNALLHARREIEVLLKLHPDSAELLDEIRARVRHELGIKEAA